MNGYDPNLNKILANRGQSAIALNAARTPGEQADPGMRYGQLGTMPPASMAPRSMMATGPQIDANDGFMPPPAPALPTSPALIDNRSNYGQNANANYGQSAIARSNQTLPTPTRPAMTNGGYGQNANANYGQSAARMGSNPAASNYWNSQNRPTSNGVQARRNPLQIGGNGPTRRNPTQIGGGGGSTL